MSRGTAAPELSFQQIREIMRPELAENVPTGRFFSNKPATKPMNTEEKQLATINPAQLMQISTDVAAVCGEIVKRSAISIKGRRYIKVEGWQALATCHGCVAGARDVERVDGGYRAIGELRRLNDGALLAVAEGFVGEDEISWFGGVDKGGKMWPRRPEYAARAMAQTRAISRVCRSAFAHVIVLIDRDLQTTPAEEIENETEVDPRGEAGPTRPAKYDQEELINRELQEAAQKRVSRSQV